MSDERFKHVQRVTGRQHGKQAAQDAQLLTAAEVADRMRVTRTTVYRWIRTGRLPSVKTPGVGHRIPASALELEDES